LTIEPTTTPPTNVQPSSQPPIEPITKPSS
jgi:hypothetical protein